MLNRKRQPPGPIQECAAGFADRRVDDQEHETAHHQPAADAHLSEHAVAATRGRRCVLGGQQRRAGPFPANREALNQAQREQDQRCGDADGRGAGNHADGDRGQPHDQQRGGQRRLAAQAITEMPEEGGAERTGEEGRGERGHRRDGGHRRAQVREEDLGKHQRRGGAVDVEVVVLDGRADIAGHRHALHRRCRHHASLRRAAQSYVGMRPRLALVRATRVSGDFRLLRVLLRGSRTLCAWHGRPALICASRPRCCCFKSPSWR